MNTTTLHHQHSKLEKKINFTPRYDRTVEWFGGVNYSNFDRAVNDIKSLLRENPREEIQLVVSSYGGSTGIGMGFYDSMTSIMKPHLTTIGTGDVDSSGVIVFLAGSKRFLTKNTHLLLHLGGRTFEEGKRFSTYDIEDMLKENKLKDYQYACVLADATEGRYSPERILELMSKNTILSAEEAVRMGLAHKVI
ncbi:MAG: Clp protease ClpP [Parcubacteria group bacterium]|nr:Clp protease ClpP [Parcubacteria group bacterium]